MQLKGEHLKILIFVQRLDLCSIVKVGHNSLKHVYTGNNKELEICVESKQLWQNSIAVEKM